MAEFERFLRYLGREDVSELVMQTGKVAALRVGGEMRPLTQKPLASNQIVALLAGSGLSELLPTQETAGAAVTVEVGAGRYDLVLARHGDELQLRVALGGHWTGRTPAAASPPGAPAPAPVQRTRPWDAGIYDPNALDLARGDAASRASARAPSGARPAEPTGEPASSASPRVARSPDPAAAPAATPTATPTSSSKRRSTARTDAIAAAPELARWLREARSRGASDLHLSAANAPRVRAVGRLVSEGAVLSDAQVRDLVHPLLDASRRARLDELGYVDFALDFEVVGRVRINVSRQQTGLKGCFRLIADSPPTLEQLGLPAELAKVTSFHQGLAIVAGPSGQGKTTTMAALVDMINATRPFHIITVEDPVEYVHEVKRALISQRQVGDHTDSFQSALKAALREDPDVIVIGELRDRETVEMALAAAETGHLVIATMSTPSGAKTIDRMINLFPPDDQQQVRATLAGALKIIVAQRLLPSVDGSRLHAAAELITGGIPLWTLIRDNKLFQLPSLLQRGRAYGMIRIEDSLRDLVQRGLVTLEAARALADDPRLVGGGEGEPGVPEAREAGGGSLRSFFTRKG